MKSGKSLCRDKTVTQKQSFGRTGNEETAMEANEAKAFIGEKVYDDSCRNWTDSDGYGNGLPIIKFRLDHCFSLNLSEFCK